MITKQKPKIGFLGLMQGLYDVSQPDLPKMQEKFAKQVVEQLKDVAEIDFPGPAKERSDIEKYVKYFNEMEYDGIMIVNLLYSPGNRLIQAMKNNNLPVLIANIQPLPDVTSNWDWILCTTNQGIHGAQDTSNVLMRCGVKPAIITDDWKSDSFKNYFEEKKAIADSIYWNSEKNWYCSLDESKNFTRKTLCGMWMLAAGIASSNRVAAAVKNNIMNKDVFNTLMPLPTLAKDEHGYNPLGEYWLGGVWINISYMTLKA